MQTRVLHERQLLHQFIKNDTPIFKKDKVNDSSILGSESKSNDHYKNLVYWLEKDEVYYNSQLDLRMVSEYLGISPNYVSKIINTHHETNFSEFINSYRIEEAKKMLKSKEFERYTILSIALEAGFNSRTAFYTSFKKHTGTSPSNFRRESTAI
jgi:YesN/AraC family two-component response regulator